VLKTAPREAGAAARGAPAAERGGLCADGERGGEARAARAADAARVRRAQSRRAAGRAEPRVPEEHPLSLRDVSRRGSASPDPERDRHDRAVHSAREARARALPQRGPASCLVQRQNNHHLSRAGVCVGCAQRKQ